MKPLPKTKHCFGCGSENIGGLNLTMHSDGKTVVAPWQPAENHGGFKGVVHGGILATALDEIMVWAIGVTSGRFCFCAEMTVRYLSPVRVGESLEISANLLTNRRDRIFTAEAKITDKSGQIVTKATGKYMPMNGEDTKKMLEDFDQNAQSFMRGGRFCLEPND